MLVMVSNPSDVLAWFAWKRTGLPGRQVAGAGTALDTARMKTLTAERARLDPRTVGGYVVGEHGDSRSVPWSTARIAGKPFARYLSGNATECPDVTLDGTGRPPAGAARRSERSKAAPNYGIAATVAAIARTVLRDGRRVMRGVHAHRRTVFARRA